MGTPVVVDSHLSHLALILLVAYFWVRSRRKRDLELALANTCAAMLDKDNEVKIKNDQILAMSKEREDSERDSITLNRRNEELQLRIIQAEAESRRLNLDLEGMCAKEREAGDVVVSLSRAMAEQVLVISDLKAKLNRVEAERSSWAHQIHLLIQDKEDLEARSQKRQQKVLELEDKLSECYARLNRRCTYDGLKSPFSLWGSPLTAPYSDKGSSDIHLQPQNPSYSAPTQSPLQ